MLRANERLAEADRRKNEFLAMLAHELRNPLAPVRNAVELLRQLGPADNVLQRQREIIDRQVSHMARLLDDLLDVARVTRGMITLQTQPLEMAYVLEQAIETIRPVIESRRHRLLYQIPEGSLCVNGDFDRLIQIFGNLMSNAAKYTEEGGQILLSAALEDGNVVVRVTDTGLGIAPEVLPRIFDLFVQADRTTNRTQGGLGIGLTMVWNLIQMHHGTVEAHSQGLGKGSEFVVRLPAIAPQACAMTMKSPRHELTLRRDESPCRKRILIVDDVRDAASSLAELLELWGCKTSVANDGPQALEMVEKLSPEIILLDIGMPGMDGYEVARRIRSQRTGYRPMLVAMTGFGQAEDKEAALAAGFDKHLLKPVDLQELENLVRAQG